MEIGEYLTNVLSINDFTSIHFKYLERQSEATKSNHLWAIEAAWRKAGALVIINNDKTGLLVFGKNSDQEIVLPPPAKGNTEGLVEIQGRQLEIKQEGTFESSSIWKALRPTPTPSSSQASNSSLPSSAEAVRNAQAANARAVQNNASPSITQEPDTISISAKSESAIVERNLSPQDIHELFITAILASLSYRLCHDSGFISLNARTLILPNSTQSRNGNDAAGTSENQIWNHNAIIIVTLDVHLTSLGSLIIKASPVLSPDLVCVLDARPYCSYGATVYLAPIGSIARYFGSDIHEDGADPVPHLDSSEEKFLADNPHLKHTMRKWKQRCTGWLKDKGILRDTFEDGGWIMVQLFPHPSFSSVSPVNVEGLYTPEEKLMTIAWPALLCFQRMPSNSSFSKLSNLPAGYDPLNFAERWFTAKADRELMVAKRKKEREVTTAAVKAQADNEARLSATNTYSPVALRRASIAGAVYPTPPDGLPIGATPSFDGNVSTPGYYNNQPLQVDGENLTIKGETEDTEGNLFEVPDAKRDPGNTSLDYVDSGNDLFGDIGGDDLFGENDITDADFSFFDEPDLVEVKQEKEQAANLVSGHLDVKSEDAAEVGLAENHHTSSRNSGQDVEMHDGHNMQNKVVEIDAMVCSPPQIASSNPSAGDPIASVSDFKLRLKSQSPPLSPEIVFQRLSTVQSMAEDMNGSSKVDRRLSIFEEVDFDKSLAQFNDKYGAHGCFTSLFLETSLPKMTANIPKTGYLSKRRKTIPTPISIVNNVVKFHPQIAALPGGRENNDNLSDRESPDRSRSSSILSDQDDTSNTTDEGPHMDYVPCLKRKRDPDEVDDNDDVTSSFQDLNMDQGQSNTTLDVLDLLDPRFLDPDPADWSFARFFSASEPRTTTTALSDMSYMAAAQILSDQAVSRPKMVPELVGSKVSSEATYHISRENAVNLVQEAFIQATRACFDRAIQCDMAEFAEVQGQHPIGQLNRLPPRPIPNSLSLHRPENLKPRAIFPLPAPHLQVRRADSTLTVLPSAIPFWENLGLGPSNGGKDVRAICIFPDGAGMAGSVDEFLEHTRSAYESGKLGTHDRFTYADITEGLVPLDFGEGASLSVADHQAVLLRINETSSKLGKLLASESAQNSNIVVYYVYDPENAEVLLSICSAFHDLFVVYKEQLSSGKSKASNELVLQLIPMDFVASRTSLVVPQPDVYSKLAMEVYDRCIDLNSGSASPSIILEAPLPRNIDFKLTSNPSASLLQENSVMHVAYAQSIDDRWITTAWTDNTGKRQATASYCLGRKNARLTTSFSDIAHEIWETTLDIIASRKVHWRIMIVKSGVMEAFEIDFWKGLASTESKAQVSLSLITVDSTPSLTLLPPSISLPPSSFTAPLASYTTPVSTPSASVISPDQSGNPQTPHSTPHNAGPTNAPTPTDSADLKFEPDATLVDVSDQTWGCVLSHRLNNSRSLLDFHPALFSGYLIKRSGAAPSDPLIVIEVNLVHSEMNPRLYEALLREVLSYYRGLATLARARGVVARDGDGRPWHIAAVEKAVAVLHLLM